MSRLALRLTVRHGATAVDVTADAAPDATVGALLAEVLQGPAAAQAWVPRLQRTVGADERLDAAGLVDGDVLDPAGGGSSVADEGIALTTAGGPDAGRRCPLPAGAAVVGRDPASALAVRDPSLSRTHFYAHREGTTVQVSDAGSANGTYVDGVRLAAGEWRPVGLDTRVEAGRTLFRLDPPSHPGASPPVRDGRIAFNRPPRVARQAPQLAERVPAPPEPSPGPSFQYAQALLPLVAGVVMALLLHNPTFLVLIVFTPMMLVSSYVSDRRSSTRNSASAGARWQEALASTAARVDAARTAEARALRDGHPDPATLLRRAVRREPELWERSPRDADFLILTLGVGVRASAVVAELADGGPADLRAEAKQRLSHTAQLPAVPVTVVCADGPVGLCGDRGAVVASARALLVQAATLHAPGELTICAAVAQARSDWGWLGWLPHCDGALGALGGALIAGDRTSGDVLLERLLALQTERRTASAARYGGGAADDERVLIVLDEELGLRGELVAGVLRAAQDTGVAVLWLGRTRTQLPGECALVVELAEDRAALSLHEVRSDVRNADVRALGVAPDTAERFARALAPLRDSGARGRAAGMPGSVALLSVLDLAEPTPEAIACRWDTSDHTLRGTVGATSNGRFELDLLTQGPHALVIGTTQSGKSEFLRSIVMAVCADHPPSEATFLLADYKGGAAFRPCRGFPHVVDVVTDLDAQTAQRALVSIRAELTRRELVLDRHQATDLSELRRRSPELAPPLLVVMVDEFAKVDEEVPGFVDGMVDIARRGRSLGVHLVLSSQTFDGSFAGGIRANTSVRVALRVASQAESEAVIDAPDAARIEASPLTRGRGYARLGHGNLIGFQTGYASGRSRATQRPPVVVRAFDVLADRRDTAPPYELAAEAESDLAAVAEAATTAAQMRGEPVPPPLWRPPLPAHVVLEDLPPVEAGVALGWADDPATQRQDPYVLDLQQAGNVVAFGAAGSGRTTFLLTVASALAHTSSPDEVHLYGLDDGRRGLDALRVLPHTGAVVSCEDLERVQLLLGGLARTIEERNAGGGQGPRTVLLLDDLAAFKTAAERSRLGLAEVLLRVMTGGRPVGVHVVLTADRRATVDAAFVPTIGDRLALRMPSDDDYRVLLNVDPAAPLVDPPPGRGFTNRGLEIQLAEPGDLERRGQRWPTPRVAPDPMAPLPATVDLAALPAAADLAAVPIGLAADRRAATADLSDRHFVVVGPAHTGRTTALAALAAGVGSLAERWLISPRRTSLTQTDGWSRVATGADIAEALQALVARPPGSPVDVDVVVFVDDAPRIADASSQRALERLVSDGHEIGVRVVAAADPNAARGALVPWLRELRADQNGLLLAPPGAEVGDLLGVTLPLRTAARLPPGRAYLAANGVATLIHVASSHT